MPVMPSPRSSHGKTGQVGTRTVRQGRFSVRMVLQLAGNNSPLQNRRLMQRIPDRMYADHGLSHEQPLIVYSTLDPSEILAGKIITFCRMIGWQSLCRPHLNPYGSATSGRIASLRMNREHLPLLCLRGLRCDQSFVCL